MPVLVRIVGGGASKPFIYPDVSNTKSVKEDLLAGFGKGILQRDGLGVVSDTLEPGDYEFHLTSQQQETSLAMKYYSHMLDGAEIDGVLTLEEGASFPVCFGRKDFTPGLNKVLARSTTKHMYEIFLYVIDGNRVDGSLHKGLVITGPPGDGKFFLCNLVKEKRRHCVYENVVDNRVWVFRSDGVCRDFSGPANHDNCPELNDPNTAYLFDAKAGPGSREPIECKAWLAVFSSANADALKQTSRAEVLPLTFITPGEKELRDAQVAFGASFDSAAQYDNFGGRLRWAFDSSSEGTEQIIATAVENLKIHKLRSLMNNDFEYTIGSSHAAPTSLFSTFLDPKRELALNHCEAYPLADATAQTAKRIALLIDLYRTRNVIWFVSSNKIFAKILRKHDEEKENVLKWMVHATNNTHFGGVAGGALEKIAPVLLGKGGDFKARVLTPFRQEMGHNSQDDTVQVEPRQVVELQVVNNKMQVKDIDDLLSSYSDATVLYNICGNFKGIDSLALPTTAYQFTVALNHPVDLETIARLNEHIMQYYKKPLVLTFCVPLANLPNWQTEQKYIVQETRVKLQHGSNTVWSGSFENEVQMPLAAEFTDINRASGMSVSINKKGVIKVTWKNGDLEINKTAVAKSMKQSKPIEFAHDGRQFSLVVSTREKVEKFGAELCEGQKKRLLGVQQKVLGLPFNMFVLPSEAYEKLKLKSLQNGQGTRHMSTLARKTTAVTESRWPWTLTRRSFGILRYVLA
eukprot:gene26868-32471_t